MVQKILNRFNFHWRRLVTGLSFALFGVGGIFLSVLVFPFVFLIPNKQIRQTVARTIVQYTFKLFIGFMRWFGVLSYETHGFDKINQRKGLLIIANHPTLLDVVFLVALIKNADCIVKAPLFKNPFMFGSVRSAQYIPNDVQDAEGLIKKCIERIHSGSNLIIFPEGTRSVEGKPIKLQRGASNIAIKGSINPTPVIISCTPPTLSKGEKWYNIPPRKVHFCLSVQNDFSITPYQSNVDSISARQLTEQLTRYFNESRS